MRASDYLPLAICVAPIVGTTPIGCFRNRISDKADLDKLPLVLWRVHDPEDSGRPDEVGQPRTRVRSNLLDGPTSAMYRFFEIECRTEKDGAYAERLAEDIVLYLRGHAVLTHILLEQDEPDDTSQKKGDYFSYLVVLGTFAVVPGARGTAALDDFERKYGRPAREQLVNKLPQQVQDELGE